MFKSLNTSRKKHSLNNSKSHEISQLNMTKASALVNIFIYQGITENI